jgi:hypothetical protein
MNKKGLRYIVGRTSEAQFGMQIYTLCTVYSTVKRAKSLKRITYDFLYFIVH